MEELLGNLVEYILRMAYKYNFAQEDLDELKSITEGARGKADEEFGYDEVEEVEETATEPTEELEDEEFV